MKSLMTVKKKERTSHQGDWRGKTLSRFRALIKQADPEAVEERKWKKPSNPAGVPVWSHDGIICTGETYKNHVRLTFAKGASLKDPNGLFNAGLEGNLLRAIVIHEGDEIDEKAFRTLIRAAVTLNESLRRQKSRSARTRIAGVNLPAIASTAARGGVAPRRPNY
ncbi:MAG TPA: DUF1801 domain-containing protein [bacterium]|nr:DUF1801 domain-containing protein [bacterium]